MEERYFLDTDEDGHWYVVPVSRKADWEAWQDLPEDDEQTWEPPDFARQVGGAPSLVTFTDPQVEGE